jgi:ribosomal protein L6P/L9E
VLDKNGIFTTVYANEQELLLKPEVFIGKKHSDIMPADINGLYNNALQNMMKGNTESYEYSMELPNGINWFSRSRLY